MFIVYTIHGGIWIYQKYLEQKDLRTENKLIDGKSFYGLVTGHENALEELYDEFPKMIDEILEEEFDDYSSVDLGEKRKEIFEKIFPIVK